MSIKDAKRGWRDFQILPTLFCRLPEEKASASFRTGLDHSASRNSYQDLTKSFEGFLWRRGRVWILYEAGFGRLHAEIAAGAAAFLIKDYNQKQYCIQGNECLSKE